MGLGLNVHRMGDICTGHGPCFPPRPSIGGSLNVLVNGIPAHRTGDLWAPHCCPDHGCHMAVLAPSPSTVRVNGRPIARIFDPITCGSRCSLIKCSPSVFAG